MKNDPHIVTYYTIEISFFDILINILTQNYKKAEEQLKLTNDILDEGNLNKLENDLYFATLQNVKLKLYESIKNDKEI